MTPETESESQMMTASKSRRPRPGRPNDAPAAELPPLCAALREARVRRGLTREQVAETLGVDAKTVQNVEEGRMPAVAERLLKHAAMLGVSLDGATTPPECPQPRERTVPPVGEMVLELLRVGSVAEMARRRGVSRQLVSKQLRDEGVDVAAILEEVARIRKGSTE